MSQPIRLILVDWLKVKTSRSRLSVKIEVKVASFLFYLFIYLQSFLVWGGVVQGIMKSLQLKLRLSWAVTISFKPKKKNK